MANIGPVNTYVGGSTEIQFLLPTINPNDCTPMLYGLTNTNIYMLDVITGSTNLLCPIIFPFQSIIGTAPITENFTEINATFSLSINGQQNSICNGDSISLTSLNSNPNYPLTYL